MVPQKRPNAPAVLLPVSHSARGSQAGMAIIPVRDESTLGHHGRATDETSGPRRGRARRFGRSFSVHSTVGIGPKASRGLTATHNDGDPAMSRSPAGLFGPRRRSVMGDENEVPKARG